LEQAKLPEYVRKLEPGECFEFRCHPGVACFTECCRALELALTPYDVLRLRKALGLSSAEFLDRYAIIEQLPEDIFPQIFLTMVDDGSASCPFVTAKGCSVYAHRPGACRTYPLGRGACQTPDGTVHDFHVLLTEPHCKGFLEGDAHTVEHWNLDQKLTQYNAFNDEVMTILQHPQVKSGMTLTTEQIEQYLLAFFRLDDFNKMLATTGFSSSVPVSEAERRDILDDDETLLKFAVRWLRHELFGE